MAFTRHLAERLCVASHSLSPVRHDITPMTFHLFHGLVSSSDVEIVGFFRVSRFHVRLNLLHAELVVEFDCWLEYGFRDNNHVA